MITLVDALARLKAAREAKEAAAAAASEAKKAFDKTQIDCRLQAVRNLLETPIYRAFTEIRDTAHKLAKSAESNYCEWYRCGPDGDDTDFTVPYPETEEPLTPFVKQLQEMAWKAQAKLNELVNAEETRIYNDFVGGKKKAAEDAKRNLDACAETYQRALEQLKFGCSGLIIDGAKIDQIEETIKKDVDDTYCQCDLFSATEDSVVLSGSIELSTSADVGDDEFYDDASDIPGLDLGPVADHLCDKICEVLERAYPGYEFEIIYDIEDPEYDGFTRHHRRYYESDTGYCEPEGDFYAGTITSSATVGIDITITKEEN